MLYNQKSSNYILDPIPFFSLFLQNISPLSFKTHKNIWFWHVYLYVSIYTNTQNIQHLFTCNKNIQVNRLSFKGNKCRCILITHSHYSQCLSVRNTFVIMIKNTEDFGSSEGKKSYLMYTLMLKNVTTEKK